jgi:PAS domain S-box-containing protein
MEDVIGVYLSKIFLSSVPKNMEILKELVRSNYRLLNVETSEIDLNGRKRIFVNNIFGVIKNGFFLRAWGTSMDITELRITEERLKEAEQRYRTVADFTYDWEYWEDPEGKMLYVSPSCERISGYSAAMFMKNSDLMQKIILEEDLEIWADRRHKAGQESDTAEIEFRILSKDNHVRWIEHACQIVHREDGKFLGVRASNRDITLRKKAEEILVKSREFNRAILRSMKDHIAVLDKKGNILSVNESWLDFALENDVSSLELIDKGQNYLDICQRVFKHSDRLASEAFDGIMQILNGSKDHFELEYPCHSPIELRWFSMKVIPFQGEKGGAIVAHSNITDRVKAEEELRKKDKLLEDAQKTVHLGSWNWNINSGELDWSDEVYRIFEFSPQAFGATYEAFLGWVHPDDHDFVKDAVDQAVSDLNTEYNIIHRIITRNGSERIVRERGNVILNDNSKPSHMVGTIQDITDIRTMEDELYNMRMEISHMDRVGTMAVLSAGISHEINQPLGAILNNAQAALRFLAHDKPDLKEVHEALQDIVSDDKRAGEIVHSIRNLMSNSDQKRGEIMVNDAVREVILLIKSDVFKQNISVSKNLQADIPSVFGSRVQIQQVILNLLMNAMDAVSKETVASRHIVISTQLMESDEILLSVSDSGPGIKKDQLETVFDSFQTTKKGGLGIGLSICRTIAREHQGTIWAENRQQGGAVFYFKLPVNGNQHG